MKNLELTFVMNADKCGNQTFTQLRREGNIVLYRRTPVGSNTIHSFEVFLVKTVKEGAALPGGGTVTETYESYPGKAAFGRHAWSCGTLKSANARFDSLVKGQLPVVEAETEETETVPVIRISKGAPRRKLNFPSQPFSQKELAAFNGIDNYKEVYTDLQRFLADGTLIKGAKRESARGKSAQLFQTPAMKSLPVVAVEA